MIFIWGIRLFGRVDEVPGMFHVATKFFHIWYIPLIPVGSHVVLGKSGKSFRGVKVPLSFKSVLLAWVRAALVAAALLAGVISALTFADAPRLSAQSAPASQTAGPVGVPSTTNVPATTTPRSELVITYVIASVEAVIALVLIGIAVLLWKVPFLRRASYARALALAEHMKITDEGRIMIERTYGRLSPDQAQAALAQAVKDREELAALEQEPEPAS